MVVHLPCGSVCRFDSYMRHVCNIVDLYQLLSCLVTYIEWVAVQNANHCIVAYNKRAVALPLVFNFVNWPETVLSLKILGDSNML